MGFDAQEWLEQAIRDAPEKTDAAPPKHLLEEGQPVSHRWKRRTYGTIQSVCKGHVYILDNWGDKVDMPITQFYKNWSFL